MATSSDPSRGPVLTALCITMMILSISAVILRVWSRLISKRQRFWWDDWCAIASLPLALTAISTILALVPAGLGHHRSQIDPQKYPLLLKYIYIHEVLFVLGITMPKYSALLFYVRVFGIKSTSGLFRKNVLVATGLVTLYLLIALPFEAFECTPVRKVWTRLIPGHCVNTYHWSVSITILSVIIDFYIMILPVPILWSLHSGHKRKVILTGVFVCAYCVIVCSLGRLVALVQVNNLDTTSGADVTWNLIPYFYWTAAELAISIVSICLPNMTQLVRRGHTHGISALFTRRDYEAEWKGRPEIRPKRSALSQERNGGFRRIMDKNGTSFPANNESLISTRVDNDLYSVSPSAQQSEKREVIALSQVHLRQGVDVRGDERWITV